MKKKPPVSFLVRIWREPTESSTEGEIRGIVQLLGSESQQLFRTMEGLWALLIGNEQSEEKSDSNPQLP